TSGRSPWRQRCRNCSANSSTGSRSELNSDIALSFFAPPSARLVRCQLDADALSRPACFVHQPHTAFPVQTYVHDFEQEHVGPLLQRHPTDCVQPIQLPGPTALVNLPAVEIDLGLVVAADLNPQVVPCAVALHIADGVGHTELRHSTQYG